MYQNAPFPDELAAMDADNWAYVNGGGLLVTNFSIREAEMLCIKAARGAGYAWGLAEEAGFAAGWLAKHGYSHLEGIAQLFENMQRDPYGKPSINHLDGVWISESGGLLCPITTGALLSDYGHRFASGRSSVAMANVGWPALLLSFVNNASRISQTNLVVVWDSCKAIMGGEPCSNCPGWRCVSC